MNTNTPDKNRPNPDENATQDDGRGAEIGLEDEPNTFEPEEDSGAAEQR